MNKILLVHNHYQQPGGEDEVFANEGALLEDHGHEVLRYTVSNDQLMGMKKQLLVRAAVWNTAAHKELRSLIRRQRPQVVHFHNTFPLISPAAYYAAHSEGVPVVQTLHNYRLLCPNGLFFRDGGVCEDCIGKSVPWPGVAHACYRGSRAASGTVTAMLTVHRALRTWTKKVDVYVALTEFARRKFIEGGITEEKIFIKPNFVHPDPGAGEGKGDYFLYVGRLSKEKGVDTVLAAWERFGGRIPLKVVGDGPMALEVAEAARKMRGVEWLGRQPGDRVLELMKDAGALIFPSSWYEGFPKVIAEAYATGLPVIASNLGSMSSLIRARGTGLHFRPDDAEDLVSQVRWVLAHPAELQRMRREARVEFEEKYTADRNYESLVQIYRVAIERSTARRGMQEAHS